MQISDEALLYSQTGKFNELPIISDSIVKLTTAYATLKDLELHEKFHMNQVDHEFGLPGEKDLNKGLQ